LGWSGPPEKELLGNNVLQRLAYLAVVFVLFPLIAPSGLAMSPRWTARLGSGAQLQAEP
jgi:thiosulfate reductase cytochrome b subunit